MAYRIIISKRAKKDLKKLDPDVKRQIRKAIDELASDPRPASSKPMKGDYKGFWRERTGNYRIIYEIRDEKLVVFVIRSGHRKDIYE